MQENFNISKCLKKILLCFKISLYWLHFIKSLSNKFIYLHVLTWYVRNKYNHEFTQWHMAGRQFFKCIRLNFPAVYVVILPSLWIIMPSLFALAKNWVTQSVKRKNVCHFLLIEPQKLINMQTLFINSATRSNAPTVVLFVYMYISFVYLKVMFIHAKIEIKWLQI